MPWCGTAPAINARYQAKQGPIPRLTRNVAPLIMRIMPNEEAASRTRLDSWKSIAIHLGRSVRTVQRWAMYQLPGPITLRTTAAKPEEKT